MERRKPLKSKKGLISRTTIHARTTLKSKKGLKATKSLQPRSEKMKKIYEKRSKFVERFLREHPNCNAKWDSKCTGRSVDVHEILPRGVGGKIIDSDESNFMAVCRYCHTMITDNPKEAHERGLRKWSWEE